MKKFKSFILFLTLTLIPAPFVQSCLDDNDPHYLAIATFRTTESNDYYFTLDNGDKMYPQQTNLSNLKDGQRVFVYFYILDKEIDGYKYIVEVKAIEKILTKELFVMDEETVDSIGDDKINISGIGFGDGYLNIKFQFLGTYNSTKLHMVNLVRNEIEGENQEEEQGYISLEFRHNAFDDKQEEVLNGIVSFKGPFTEEDMKGLKIRYKSIYDGIKYTKIDFEKESTTQSVLNSGTGITEMPIAY